MSGNLSFREALKIRLQLINPSKQLLDEFIKTQSDKLTPGAKCLVDHLHMKKIPVYLVSGGFRYIINPVAKMLNIEIDNVYANKLLFDSNGKI